MSKPPGIARPKKDYQNKLDNIKESGSLDKQSTMGNPKLPGIVLSPKRTGSPLERSSRIPVFSGSKTRLGDSIYDESSINLPVDFYDDSPEAQQDILESELQEMRAQNQPASTKLLAGLGRAAVKAGSEFGKGVGYITGLPQAILSGELDDVVNNSLVKAFESLDEAAKEAMPVYVRREIENGSFFRQIGSPEFYATEGADALGFLVSAILLGGATKGLTTAIGFSKGIANLSKFMKLTGGGQKVANAVDNFLITGAQSYYESWAETDGSIQEFDDHWESLKQQDGTYLTEDGEVVSEDQVRALRGDLGSSVFWMNMVATMPANVFMTKALFGSGGGSKNFLDKLGITDKSLPGIAEGITQATKRSKLIANIAKEGLKGSGQEAFQELSQFAIQEYEKAKSTMKTDDGLVEGLIKGYVDGLTTVEGQKSMFLGGLLGLGPGLIKGFKERKALINQATGLSKLMQESMVDLKTDFESYYKKNEDGSLIKDPKTKKPILDINRIQKDLENSENEINDNAILNYLKSKGLTHGAKMLVTKKMIEKALPYFQIEGGDAIFKEHFKDLTEAFDADGTMLGFNSKKEYTDYLEEVVSEGKKEFDNIKNIGPRYFGLDISKYIEKLGDKKGAKAALEAFYNQMEVQGTIYGAFTSLNKKELKEINDKIDAIETTANIVEDIEDTSALPKKGSPEYIKNVLAKIKKLPDSAKIGREYALLLESKNSLEKQLKGLNDNYNSIFKKSEQQKAFNDKLQQELDKQQAQEEFEKASGENEEFATEFYDNLIKKGYAEDVEGLKDAFASNQIKLQNNKGEVFSIQKEFDESTNKSTYFIMPVNEVGIPLRNKKKVLNKGSLEQLGLTGMEAILSPEEYADWKRQQRITNMNNRRLSYLETLARRTLAKRQRTVDTIDQYKKRLDALNEQVTFWKNQNEIPLSEIANEIEALEQQYEQIEKELEDVIENRRMLGESLAVLSRLRTEIKSAIADNVQFSFGIKLQELKKEFEDNGFIEDEKYINDFIDVTEAQIEDLSELSANLKDSIDDLYQFIIDNKNLKELVEEVNRGGEIKYAPIFKLMQKYYPEVLYKNKVKPSEENIAALLSNEVARREFLKALKSSQQDAINTYVETKANLTEVNDSLAKAQATYNKLAANQQILKRNESIEKNIRYLITKNNIALNQEKQKDYTLGTFHQNGGRRTEQDGSETDPRGTGPLKTNPYSTIVNIYSDRAGTTIHENPDKLKQSSNWAQAMMDIQLEDMDAYSLQIVDNQGLEIMGIKPPIEDDTALYGVLLKDGEPYTNTADEKIFTGIANVNTYFPIGEEPTIDVLRNNPDYNQALKVEITEDNPYISLDGEKAYTSLEDLATAIKQEARDDYEKWRNSLVEQTSKGEEIFFKVTDVSKGFPLNRDDTTRFDPRKSLPIDHLQIGSKFISKDNGVKEPVEDGKVYAILDNGQVQRVMNKAIGTLPAKERLIYLNRIISFMALVNKLGSNYNQPFTIVNSKNKPRVYKGEVQTMPLFGNSKKPGMLDTLIAWNTKNEDWNIKFLTKKATGEKAFVFKIAGEEVYLKAEDLLDVNGNVRKVGDPALAALVDYLDYKHLNVVEGLLGKNKKGNPRGAFIPTSTGQLPGGEVVIYGKPVKSYTDYVLDNYLYTNIPPVSKSDKLPQFVNQYASFDKDNPLTDPPDKTAKAEPTPAYSYTVVKEGETTAPIPVTKEAPAQQATGDIAKALTTNTVDATDPFAGLEQFASNSFDTVIKTAVKVKKARRELIEEVEEAYEEREQKFKDNEITLKEYNAPMTVIRDLFEGEESNIFGKAIAITGNSKEELINIINEQFDQNENTAVKKEKKENCPDGSIFNAKPKLGT